MEKQFNLDLEPTRSDEILTCTVGASPSPDRPLLRIVHQEPDAYAYFLDVGNGELTLHISMDLDREMTIERMKRYYNVFLNLKIALEDRGMDEIFTWIEEGNEKQRRVAHFFGFEETGFLKQVTLQDGSEYLMEEMKNAS